MMEIKNLNELNGVEDYLESIILKVVFRLRRVPRDAMSLKDTELRSFWEEVCVQVQVDRFMQWPMVEDLILGYCSDVFEKLPWPDQVLISQVACEELGVKYEPYSVFTETAAVFLSSKVIEYAGNYENERILKFWY